MTTSTSRLAETNYVPDEVKNSELRQRAEKIYQDSRVKLPAVVDISDRPARAVQNQGRVWRNLGIAGIAIGSTVTAAFLVALLATTVPSFNNTISQSSATGLKITDFLARNNTAIVGATVGGLAIGVLLTSGGALSMVWYRKGIVKMQREKDAIAQEMVNNQKAFETNLIKKNTDKVLDLIGGVNQVQQKEKALKDELRNKIQLIYAELERLCDEIENENPLVSEERKEADKAAIFQLLNALNNLDPQNDESEAEGSEVDNGEKVLEITARAEKAEQHLREATERAGASEKSLGAATERAESAEKSLVQANKRASSAEEARDVYLVARNTHVGLKAQFAGKQAEVDEKQALFNDHLGTQKFDELPAESPLKAEKAALDKAVAELTALRQQLVESKAAKATALKNLGPSGSV